jgi:hypothetical protein
LGEAQLTWKSWASPSEGEGVNSEGDGRSRSYTIWTSISERKERRLVSQQKSSSFLSLHIFHLRNVSSLPVELEVSRLTRLDPALPTPLCRLRRPRQIARQPTAPQPRPSTLVFAEDDRFRDGGFLCAFLDDAGERGEPVRKAACDGLVEEGGEAGERG